MQIKPLSCSAAGEHQLLVLVLLLLLLLLPFGAAQRSVHRVGQHLDAHAVSRRRT